MAKVKIEAKIFGCSQSMELAKNIADHYGATLGNVLFSRYSDGEFQPSFEESIRGARIFIIGSTQPSSENLMEMLLMLDAAKRASARHITAVIPYFGWARQDRKDKPRVPIGAKLIAKLLESAGATRIITMDLHADQIQGFFEKPVDHLFASSMFLPYLKNLNLDNLTIASPDMGGAKRAYAYAKYLESDVVICYKQRQKANVISHMELIGEVKGNGTSHALINYNYIDKTIPTHENMVYYRLNQVDFDGESALTDVRLVQFKGFSNAPLVVYPNPTRNETTIILGNNVSQGDYTITDLVGKQWMADVVQSGSKSIQLDFSNLPSGVYIATLNADGQDSRNVRIVKH